MEVSELVDVRVAILSDRQEWREQLAIQLKGLGVKDLHLASPTSEIPPAAISIIDAAGVIPSVVGRTIFGLSSDAPPTLTAPSIQLPASDEQLRALLHQEIAELSVAGTTLDPEFRVAALETLFYLSTESVEFVDPNIRLLDVNHAFVINTGHSLPTVIGKTTAELFRTGDMDPEFYGEIDRTLSSGNVWRGQLTARRKDGRVSYQESVLSPIKLRGEIAGYVAVKRDLDRDELAAQALTGEGKQVDAVINNAADPIFVHDFTGLVFDSNLSGAAFLAQEGEPREQNILNLFDTASSTKLIRHWGCLDRPHVQEIDCPLRVTDGNETRVLSVRSGLVKVGDETLIISIGRDVTTRTTLARALQRRTEDLESAIAALQDAQAALVAEEARAAALEERARSSKLINDRQLWFRAIFEGARDAMIIGSRDGTIADVNRATIALTQRDKRSLVGANLIDLFTEDCRDEIASVISNLEVNGSPQHLLELKMRRGGREHADVSVNLTQVVIDNEPHIHIVARDLTMLKRAEAERGQLEKRLRQAQQLESLGTLAGGIAHDFNNLLGPIIAYSEMLEPFTAMDMDAEDMRRDIVTAASRAAELVKRILHFSRRSERRVRTIYVAEVLSEVARLLQRTLPPGLSLVFGEVDVDARIACDATELQQVIMNLCTNAIHAMENGGGVLSLTIGRMGLASSADEVEAPDDLGSGDYVCISIADTGHGMTPEIRDRVFEPYFTTKTTTRGTGLGLATVFGIVRDLGGTIRVQSEVSVGTQFDVYIPVSTKPAEPILAVDSQLSINELGIEHILVIDDEPSNIRMLDRVLATFGAKVTGFTKPNDALLHLRGCSRDYDVLITDLTMPGMTGIELTRELRTFDRYLPVIVYTGYGDDKNEANAIAAGARMMIRKPVTRRVLLRSLSVLVEEGFVAAGRDRQRDNTAGEHKKKTP